MYSTALLSSSIVVAYHYLFSWEGRLNSFVPYKLNPKFTWPARNSRAVGKDQKTLLNITCSLKSSHSFYLIFFLPTKHPRNCYCESTCQAVLLMISPLEMCYNQVDDSILLSNLQFTAFCWQRCFSSDGNASVIHSLITLSSYYWLGTIHAEGDARHSDASMFIKAAINVLKLL